jgi:hypothetical protein
MDSRKTTQGDGDERTTENVVRLPRDWLGPREELVPIGSRARAAETPDDAPPESLPPTAASFWDEDSGSLQAPMQAPADTWQGRWEPASPGQAAPAGSTPSRLWRIPRLQRVPRLHRPRSLRGGFAPPGRPGMAAVAGVLGACILVVLAVIGETAGGTHNPGGKTAAVSKSAAIVTATGVNRARLRAHTPVVTEIRTEPASRHAQRSSARKHRSRVSARRHHPRPAARPTPSASQPVRSTTPTYTPSPTTSAPSPGSTSSSAPASSARSTSSSSQHQSAFGQSGSLGPGSSPDS